MVNWTSRESRNFLFLITTSFAITLTLGSHAILASGGYSGAGINQDKGSDVDRNLYELGKSIYTNKIQTATFNEELKFAQLEKLARIQGSLPRPEQRRVDLIRLAGFLDANQIDALVHFVSIRFNVKLEDKK